MPYVNQWDGDDLCNLLELTNSELYVIYDYMERHVIRRIANKYRELERKGMVRKPERSQPYGGPEIERARAAERRERAQSGLGKSAVGKMVRISVPEEHYHYHQSLQAALDDHGALTKARFSDWQSLTKNNDGEAEIHDLKGTRFEVKFDTKHEAMIQSLRDIQPIKAPRVNKTRRPEVLKGPEAPRKALMGGDWHFGYLRMAGGELMPTHDEDAISLFHQVAADLQPDKIMLGGDTFDFAGLSRWEQLGIFLDTLNPTLMRVAQFLDQLKKDCPDAEIIWEDGNHDDRPAKMRRVGSQVAELLKAAVNGEGEAVLSVPHLLDFKGRGITYVRGGNARAQVNERLGMEHRGNDKKSLGRKLVSTIGFDKHSPNMPRPEVIETPWGPQTIYHYTIGMMGRVDGIIPSWMSSYNNNQVPDEALMNWVQMFAVVDYLEGNQPFQVNMISTNPHDNYRAMYNGKLYQPPREEPGYA